MMYSPFLSVLALCLAVNISYAQHNHSSQSPGVAKQNAKNNEQIFDEFLRWGGMPIEIKVNMYRTTPSSMNLGPFVGTIIAKNTKVRVGNREEDALMLKIKMFGLRPGPHAFHIHEYADCRAKEQDGKSVPGLAAGGHLFVEAYHEGTKKVYKNHLGSLPHLAVEADGTASEEMIVPRLTLGDLWNRSIMVHSSHEDTSGRDACGIFR